MIRQICIWLQRCYVEPGGEFVDIVTQMQEIDLSGDASVYEFCENRGRGGWGPEWGCSAMCLSDLLDAADNMGSLFTMGKSNKFVFHVCNPIHLDKPHRAFYLSGHPDKVAQSVFDQLEEWARMVQRERVLGRRKRTKIDKSIVHLPALA